MRPIPFTIAALGLAALMVALPASSAMAESACPERLDAMIAAAYPDATAQEYGRNRLRGPDRGFFRSDIACGMVPGATGLIVVLVSIAHDEGDELIDSIGDLEVLVFKEGADAPHHRILERRLTSEDAFSISSIKVDPTLYDLAGNGTVFGVLMTRENRARYNPASVSTLRLYQIAEGKLEAILVNLAMRQSFSEWNGNCEGEKEVTSREVLVGDHGAGGYADLTIVGRTERAVISGRAEPCEETMDVIREEKVLLTFDGESYPVPETLRGFDEDY